MTFVKNNINRVKELIKAIDINSIQPCSLYSDGKEMMIVICDEMKLMNKMIEKYANEVICTFNVFSLNADSFEECKKEFEEDKVEVEKKIRQRKLKLVKFDFVEYQKNVEMNDMLKNLIEKTKCEETMQWNVSYTQQNDIELTFARKNVEIREMKHVIESIGNVCERNEIDIQSGSVGIRSIHQIENYLVGKLTLKSENLQGKKLYQFINEFVGLQFSWQNDVIHEKMVEKGIISSLESSLLRAFTLFAEQMLCNINNDIFTIETIHEALTFHSSITRLLLDVFDIKFNPTWNDEYTTEITENESTHGMKYPSTMCSVSSERIEEYTNQMKRVKDVIKGIDTGRMKNDMRRKIILESMTVIVDHIVKTNYYAIDKVAIGFRLNPTYLTYLDSINTISTFEYSQSNRRQKFPEIPFGVFYVYNSNFFGFQIRFRDLARGGLRTVINRDYDMWNFQRTRIFEECYNLAYTQQKKNKDIPEGGSKGIIFLQPNEIHCDRVIIEEKLKLAGTDVVFEGEKFESTMRNHYLYHNQKRFLTTFLSLINFELIAKEKQNETGRTYELTEKLILDYYNQPEFIYLGPDENMHDYMIEWLSHESMRIHYFCGGAFISGKEETGINHKEYGVTSIGVFEYLKIGLQHLHLPSYSIKITGGPNGDVAGNLIHLIKTHHKDICTIKSICSSICVVLDNQGIDITELDTLFINNKALQHFTVDKLHNDGFMLRLDIKQTDENCIEHYKLWRKQNGKIEEEWIESTQAMKLYETTVHQNVVDVFAPCGGRPFSLNENNINTFFVKDSGSAKTIPTCKLIVEGANLYFSPKARETLEKNGVLIFKDSSANKCGVVSSSYEILGGLGLDDDQFISIKKEYAKGIIERLKCIAQQEGNCMIDALNKNYSQSMVKISEEISRKINEITDEINEYLKEKDLFDEKNRKFLDVFVQYIPSALEKFKDQLLIRIPQMHMKAIIATSLATKVVYSKGLLWNVSIIDIIDTIL